MRKIEQRIINALREQSEFRSGNTEVRNERDTDALTGRVLPAGDVLGKVLLHGNLIATFNRSLNQLEIEDGGWESVTTKGRLNALLSEFAPAYRIIQKNWVWYIDDLSCEISENVSHKDILTEWTGAAIFRAGSLIETVG